MNATLALVLACCARVPGGETEELTELLRRTPDDRRDRATLVLELARFGGGERAPLVRLALGTGVEELVAQDGGARWIVAPEALPGIASEALARLSGRATCEALARELGSEPAPAHQRGALRLLATLESSACSELAWRLFLDQDPLVLAAAARREESLAALTAAFRYDGDSAATALAQAGELAPLQVELVFAAVAAGGRAELADGLQAHLGDAHHPHFRPALAALVELERRAPYELAGRSLAVYAEHAPWLEPGERAELLHALVACEDAELAAHVLELAAAPEPRTRRLARAAWQTLARTTPAEDPDEQAAWHARELEWFEGRHEPLLAEFVGDDPAAAVRALHECLRHPLFRRELAAGLAEALVEARTEAALAAIPALAAWGSHAAVPGLELALDAKSSEVRALAAETLGLLTGVRPVLSD